MKKINTALFCLFVLLFCSCDVLNKAPLDEIADDSFWSDETLVKYYIGGFGLGGLFGGFLGI